MSRVMLRCQACRHSLLDNFAALAGVSIPFQSLRPLPLRPQPWRPQRRTYTSSRKLAQSSNPSTTSPSGEHFDEASQPPSSNSDTLASASSSSIPWYLQVPTPTPPAPVSPILALQEIPPLPSNPPTILEPLLEHLSVKIGLDNLSLLDLRNLHPPPALGANLLMILGTARSVKHLNVSADRFCRWLRTEWKLRPYADGLLGRNELKLKLRRKARRQKMMSLVGGREVGTEDDGITTGWVCVNVGIVDENLQPSGKPAEEYGGQKPQDYEAGNAELEAKQNAESQVTELEGEADFDQDSEPEDDYVGFGSRSTSPRIVVQMFTEAKRLEMDLEGLWDDRNTRRTRKGAEREARAENTLKMRGWVVNETEDDETDENGGIQDRLNKVWEHKTRAEDQQYRREAEKKRAGQGKRMRRKDMVGGEDD